MIFLSTFISGFQDVVGDILAKYRAKRICALWDGAAVYENAHFINAPCFNNTFEVLRSQKAYGAQVLDSFAADVVRHARSLSLGGMKSKRAGSFRIVSSFENGLVSVNPKVKGALETMLRDTTGLSLNRAKADVEFWLYARREGHCFFLRRITRNRLTEKDLQKGELRPELAFFLNWLSDPQKQDVYLDPFCGSGALPISRAKLGAFQRMYVSDLDFEKVGMAEARLREAKDFDKRQHTFRVLGVEDLPEAIPLGSVSKIVTDPPWGYYEKCDVESLYRRMMGAFSTVAKPGAIIVLLSAQKETMERILMEFTSSVAVTHVYHILVSGKKAAVYVMRRIP